MASHVNRLTTKKWFLYYFVTIFESVSQQSERLGSSRWRYLNLIKMQWVMPNYWKPALSLLNFFNRTPACNNSKTDRWTPSDCYSTYCAVTCVSHGSEKIHSRSSSWNVKCSRTKNGWSIRISTSFSRFTYCVFLSRTMCRFSSTLTVHATATTVLFINKKRETKIIDVQYTKKLKDCNKMWKKNSFFMHCTTMLTGNYFHVHLANSVYCLYSVHIQLCSKYWIEMKA